MKSIKKIGALALAIGMAFSCVACGETETGNTDLMQELLKDDFTLETLTGNEQEIQVLYDSGYLSSSGYVDQFAERTKNNLLSNGTGKNGVMQYFISKALHNYNVKENNLRVNYLDWGWGDTLTQKLTSSFVAKSGPSVIIGESQIPQYAEDGLLKAFPEWLETEVRENCISAAYEVMEVDGKIYGLSFYPSVTMMFWNKDILRKAGVDEKYIDKAPETWEEFLSVCKTINSKGYSAGGLYCGDDLGGYLRSYPFMLMNSGKITDESGNIVVNSEENAETLQYFRDVAGYSLSGVLSYNETTLDKQFNSGKIAYILDGTWRYENSMAAGFTAENIGYGRMPSPTGEETDTTLIGAMYFAVPNYASNAESAFKFIQSLISEEVQYQMARFNLRPTVLKSAGESDWFKTLSPVQYETFKLLNGGKAVGLPTYSKNNTEIWASFGKMISKAAATNESISSILTTAQTEISGYLK